MNKIICSLEEYDSILDYYRPNGSSKTWYLKEMKKVQLPTMWADWTVLSEQGEMFDRGYFKNLITPQYTSNIEYLTSDKINGRPHIYIINIASHSFFETNGPIGFSCISENYLNDIREGRAMIAMFFLYEGYSGIQGNRDFEIIEDWRRRSKLPPNSIYYINGNLISQNLVNERGYGFQARGIHYFEPWNKYSEPMVSFKPIDNKYLYLSYNRATRHHRIMLGLELVRCGIFEKGLISMNKLNHPLPVRGNPDDEKFLVDNSPFIIDSKYDLHYNLACNITRNDYERTFISLITETLVDEDTLFFSEKIWKPIMVGHPFILLGNQYSLKYLKELGYKTFDKWIDESYDQMKYRHERVSHIVNELKKFSRKSVDELKQIREEMNEVCLFNQLHYKKLYDEKYYDGDKNRDIKTVLVEMWETLTGESKNLTDSYGENFYNVT